MRHRQCKLSGFSLSRITQTNICYELKTIFTLNVADTCDLLNLHMSLPTEAVATFCRTNLEVAFTNVLKHFPAQFQTTVLITALDDMKLPLPRQYIDIASNLCGNGEVSTLSKCH